MATAVYPRLVPMPPDPQIIPEAQTFDINALEEKDLYNFFLTNDQSLTPTEKASLPKKELTTFDFLHFIWMGSPLKDEYKENILKWKRLYPDIQVILWADINSLEETTKQFCRENNILLLSIENTLQPHIQKELNDAMERDRKKIPPVWQSISDILRYHILFYFGGMYSDTDVNPEQIQCFSIKQNFHDILGDKKVMMPPVEEGGNDILFSRELRASFFGDTFSSIASNYKSAGRILLLFRIFRCRSYRYRIILGRTSSELYYNTQLRKSFWYRHIGEIPGYVQMTSFKGLSVIFQDEKFLENYARHPSIENDVLYNLIEELNDRNRLDIDRYMKILSRVPGFNREAFIQRLITVINHALRLNRLVNVEAIFTSDPNEYKRIISSLPKERVKHTLHHIELKKAIKRQNNDMVSFLLETYKNSYLNFLPILIAKALFFNNPTALELLASKMKEPDVEVNLTEIFILLARFTRRTNFDVNDLVNFFQRHVNPEFNFQEYLSNRSNFKKFETDDLCYFQMKNFDKYGFFAFARYHLNKNPFKRWVFDNLPTEQQSSIQRDFSFPVPVVAVT